MTQEQEPDQLPYAVWNESGQIVARTKTRWVAERLIEGIRATDSLTSKLGSWSITPGTNQ